MTSQVTFNHSTLQDLKNHFESISQHFIESLEGEVVISEYLLKLSSKSSRIEIWEKECIIGLLCYYIVDDNDEVFITHISVSSNFEKQGIGKELLSECLRRNRNKNLKLEVSKENLNAIALYLAFGFKQFQQPSDKLIMFFGKTRP